MPPERRAVRDEMFRARQQAVLIGEASTLEATHASRSQRRAQIRIFA